MTVYLPAMLLVMLHNRDLTLIFSMQRKSYVQFGHTDECFPAAHSCVTCSMQYKVVLTFEPVDEILLYNVPLND